MDKTKVDGIITEYLEKIYGFAIKKSFSYEEAEELSAEIVKECYLSLLKSEEVYNIEGYIWRISEHVYSKYVAVKKRHEGISLDNVTVSYEERWFFEDDSAEELLRLRREVAYLTTTRRRIVYLFYYKSCPIASIARQLGMPAGTVKWHLNKARKELKEGFQMERAIGKLGISPVKATSMGHSGHTGKMAGPETFLADKLDLNIVYSVYHKPRTTEEIAEELGVTPVFIEDKIACLEANGYLVKTAGDRFTTYVYFQPEYRSLEQEEQRTKMQLKAAELLLEEYVPAVRAAIADFKDAYIPSGNRELLQAAAIFYGVSEKCALTTDRDLSKYYIKDTAGGKYIALVELEKECVDPDFKPTIPQKDYGACGSMNRCSCKYPVSSWSTDTRIDSRTGYWKNNLNSDYEYLYEFLSGAIKDDAANAEKFARLKERAFLSQENKVEVMMLKDGKAFKNAIPRLSEEQKNRFAEYALESAMQKAKHYPAQMQDLVVDWAVSNFIGSAVAIMVMDLLYEKGIFRPLTEEEKISANLLVFSDILPE